MSDDESHVDLKTPTISLDCLDELGSFYSADEPIALWDGVSAVRKQH